MPKINPIKFNKYREIQADPSLAIFKSLNDLEDKIENKLKECDRKMEAMLEEKMAKMEQKEPMHANFIQKIVNQAVAQVIGNSRGDKGDSIIGPIGPRGEKGDSFIGSQGERGPQGPVGSQGVTGKDGRNGLNGENGKNPIKGVDYFMEKDKQTFVEKIKESLEMEKLIEKINELIKIVDGLQRVQKLGGQKTMHRGGMALEWENVGGTIDGSNTIFTLANTPYDSDKLLFFVNGLLQRKTDDYTISGVTITTLTAPPKDSLISAFYRRS